MKRNSGKILLCVIVSLILILAGSYLLRLTRDTNNTLTRLRRAGGNGNITTVQLKELPSGNYNSDTTEYIWRYEYVDENGELREGSTAGRYSRSQLQDSDYLMEVCYLGAESMEKPYLDTVKKHNYNGVILFYVFAVLPLLFIVWLAIDRAIMEQILKNGETYYAAFISAFRSGSYYKVKFEFDVDGKKIVKTTRAMYPYSAVEVFKNTGVIEIKYYKGRAIISQSILGITLNR